MAHARRLLSRLAAASLALALAGCAGPRADAPAAYPRLLPMDEILAEAGVAPRAP